MKLLHTSDLHLDSPLTSRLSQVKARERKRELIQSFRKLTEDAKRLGAPAVIIAGDLFDSDAVGIRTLEAVIGIIENSAPTYFFYLPGNHEGERLISSGISIPQNLKIFGSEWTYYELGELTLAGRSEISANMFDSLKLDSERKNIVILHGVLADRCQEPDKIGQRELSQLPIDYLALGHYHSYSKTEISDRTTAVYCGTPEGRGFDEAGDCGYVIIDTDTVGVSHSFVKSSLRKMRIIPVDISGALREIEIENRVAHALFGIDECDLVRVVLVGEYEPGIRRDTESLTLRFSDSYYYFEVKDESKLRISSEDYINDKSLKGEFIRLVLSKEELSTKERDAIIECGIRALAGEPI